LIRQFKSLRAPMKKYFSDHYLFSSSLLSAKFISLPLILQYLFFISFLNDD